MYDVAVIGGGVMGCSTALHLARGGMRCILLERGGLCREASGRNAGTLTPMYTRPELVPHAIRGREMWKAASEWLGADAGFQDLPGLALAFSDHAAELLATEMAERADAGAPIRIISREEAQKIEPVVGDRTVAAAYCPADGYADSNRLGALFRRALVQSGVTTREATLVTGAEPSGTGFVLRVEREVEPVRASRIVIAGGAWIGNIVRWFGIELPLVCRVDQGTITERTRPLLRAQILVFGELSLKQFPNGTILMGGGRVQHWIDEPDHAAQQMDPERIKGKMLAAMRAAYDAVPALGNVRVLRTWVGFEGYTPDNQPIIGPLGVPGVYVMGCARSGFTTGPYLGKLLADEMLGKTPEVPIFLDAFDPRRLKGMVRVDAATKNQS